MKLTIDHSKVSHERLGPEPVDKLLFKMALPSVIAMIMQALYNSVDSMFVAKISSESLAAVTLAFPVTMIIGAMSTGIGACIMKIKGIVMHGRHNNNRIRRTVDICMTVSLLFLMAYQVTGEVLHEWIGIAMTVLVIVHQILNRKWYSAVFRGRYNAYRIMTTAVNILLLLSFVMTALSGMSMSGHAVPFMYGMVPVSLARKMHLAMSHWSFVMMGLHLGLHIPVMTAKMKSEGKTRTAAAAVFCCLAGAGLFLFVRNGWADYMFFRTAFAFLDHDKAGVLVFLENILMLIFWAFIGDLAAVAARRSERGDADA